MWEAIVKRQHMMDTRPGASPRVLNKLTMCFNPRRMIDPGSTAVSGLCNDLLEHETDFNINVFNAISSFLQCLEKPLCLVAENGHAFDFPILKNHFEKLNVSLSDDILCADSLHAFHDILEADASINTSKSPHASIDQNPTGSPSSSVVNNSADNEVIATNNNEILSDQTAGKISEEVLKLTPDFKKMGKDIKLLSNAQIEELITPEVLQDFNENKDLLSQKLIQQQNETTPKHNRQPKPINKKSKVRRKLFWGDKIQPKISYKLKDIYERVLQRPAVEAHRAENDCIMAMEISVSITKQFVEWVDNNHCAFAEVNPMRLGVPIGD